MSVNPVTEKIYYKDLYWNDHPKTQVYMADRLSLYECSQKLFWMDHLKRNYFQNKAAKKALFINCGNGWAERDLFDRNIFESGVGFDFSEELLKEASSKLNGRPITYFQADCNSVEFEPGSFDLIVNVAAMHHVQYINRMHYVLASSLTEDGLFVNFDYVGPHRNQYSNDHWQLICDCNSRLPIGLRSEPLNPPHLPTMLLHDPTEAIHSELIFRMFNRYFIEIERKDFNGGIAYQIMHNNKPLYLDLAVAEDSVEFLLACDELCTFNGACPPLFSFFVGRPRRSILSNQEHLKSFSEEEELREKNAKSHGGLYY